MLILVYIWHLLILPITAALLILSSVPIAAMQLVQSRRSLDVTDPPTKTGDNPNPEPPPDAPALAPSRRQFLLAAAVALPPLVAGGTILGSYRQIQRFRVRRLIVDIPDLPQALNDLTVAHITDMHVGRFTYGRKLREVADVANQLNADLVLMTGDLIDYAIRDLPAALETVKRIDRPERIFLCEGNHDLFENREEFEGELQRFETQYGVPLLVNDSRTLSINGQNVQILGLRTGPRPRPRGLVHR